MGLETAYTLLLDDTSTVDKAGKCACEHLPTPVEVPPVTHVDEQDRAILKLQRQHKCRLRVVRDVGAIPCRPEQPTEALQTALPKSTAFPQCQCSQCCWVCAPARTSSCQDRRSPEAGVGSLSQLVRGIDCAAAANSCGGLGAHPVRWDANRK